MQRGLVALLLVTHLGLAAAGSVQLDIGRVDGDGWSADGVQLHIGADGAARARAQVVRAEALPDTASVELRCAAGSLDGGLLRCVDGRLDAVLPWVGRTRAGIDARVRHAQAWSVSLRDLRTEAVDVQQVQADQAEAGLTVSLRLAGQPLGRLLPVAAALELPLPDMEVAGVLDLSASGRWRDAKDWELHADMASSALDFASADGRHAGEGLQVALTLIAHGRAEEVRLQPQIGATQGQIYIEPIFVDFGLHPADIELDARWDAQQRRLAVASLVLHQEGVMRAEASAEVMPDAELPLQRLHATLHEGRLPEFAEYYLQPFLAGGPLDRLHGSGRVVADLQLRDGVPERAHLVLSRVGIGMPKLHIDIDGLDGELHWAEAAEQSAPSSLSWEEGHVAAIPFGAARLELSAHGAELRLDAPLRIPIFDGALLVRRLALDGIGTPELGARFAGEVEPLDLELLTRALGWPELQGRLAGQLPGMRLEGGNIALDGALTAQVFDGAIAITQLRVLDAFGVLPRIAADLHLRGLDLLAVTGTYDFGSIEGRLDGEVAGLRMLGGRPVAFDARIYTPPGDRSRRRISQRAIDNISAVAGGPSGIVSGGVLRFFSDFPYRRLGWSCRLRDGVCHMDGVAPADNNGYYLVQGRGLPRIDVIGHGRRVDWQTLLQQLQSVRLEDSDEP